MTSLTYPADQNGAPGPDTYTYDAMGRLSTYGASWNPDGTLATFNGQTRTYNTLGQLTRILSPGNIDMQYVYTAGQNNGRVAQTVDGIAGETVNYTYDTLNRLAGAQAAGGAWGNAYTYDGWGNLTAKAVTAGTAPTFSANPDPSRNGGADPTVIDPSLDVENRGIGNPPNNGGQSYTYDGSGKMVYALNNAGWQNGVTQVCELRFYGITGQRLARHACNYGRDGNGLWSFSYSLTDREHKELGILTDWGGKSVSTDRLGSVRADTSRGRYTYYPYGEVKSAPAGQTGLYGDLEDPLRGYDSNAARWSVPDPLGMKAADAGNPNTWNRFAYAGGDPVNFKDPRGLFALAAGYGGNDEDPPPDDCSDMRSLDPACFNPGAGAGGVGGGGGDPAASAGSASGSGDVTAVKNLAHNAVLDKTFNAIRGAFSQNPNSDCAGWFNAAFMTSPENVASSGTLDGYLSQLATVSGAGSFVGGNANALANSPLTPGTVVAVNTNGAFFNSLAANTVIAPSDDFSSQFAAINGGSAQAQMFILLHEIAHTLGMIRPNDGGSDATSFANQRFNNDEIWRNCSGTITAFPNR